MPNRRGRAALQVGDAANVGGGDDFGFDFPKGGVQIDELSVAQFIRQLGVEHLVSARRAAAQVRLAASDLDGEAQSAQVLLDPAA